MHAMHAMIRAMQCNDQTAEHRPFLLGDGQAALLAIAVSEGAGSIGRRSVLQNVQRAEGEPLQTLLRETRVKSVIFFCQTVSGPVTVCGCHICVWCKQS